MALELWTANWHAQLEIAVQTVIAATLGGLVGLEREIANRPAGLRTHAIMAAAAALLVGMADPLVMQFSSETTPGLLRVDPIRVIEAIVTGVAFIGAGTIFRQRGSDATVQGLTTAASLLLVSAIGIAVALGLLLLAVLVCLMALLVLRGIRWLEPKKR